MSFTSTITATPQSFFYVAFSPYFHTDVPSPSSLYISRDAGATYQFYNTLDRSGVIGHATTALGNTNVNVGIFDRVNTVDVEVYNGELDSLTEGQVAGGRNIAYLGGEVIGFMTATAQDERTWRLSGLLRGLDGTDSAMGSHAAGDQFMLLDPDKIHMIPIELGDVGAPLKIKCTPVGMPGGPASDEVVTDFTPGEAEFTPRKPAHVAATVDSGTDDITVTWTRVSRAPLARLFSKFGVPQLDQDAYKVEVLDTGVVVRTDETPTSGTWTYTESMQRADFAGSTLTELDSDLEVRVYQRNELVGYGPAAEETLALEVS